MDTPAPSGGFLAVVKIRRDTSMEVKPEAEQIDGGMYYFRYGWEIEDDDDRYPGESAFIPVDPNWPLDAPAWIASGDLVL